MAGRTETEPMPLAPPPRRVTTVGTSSMALQASARRLDAGATKGADALQPETREAAQAWEDYRLPEVQKLVTSSAGLMSQCRLYVGFVDERGVEHPLRDEDGRPVEGFDEGFVTDCEVTLARFTDRNGSQRGLLMSFAECWQVTGEAYIVGWPIAEDGEPTEVTADGRAVDPNRPPTDERWEVLSRAAIGKASGRWVVSLEPGKQIKLPEVTTVFRMWISHPRFPYQSRSWVQAVAEPAMDLRVFTRAQRAAGRSNTVADLALVPSEASPRVMPNLPPPMPGAPKPAGDVTLPGQPGNPMGDASKFATFIERIIADAVLEVQRDAQAGRTVINPTIAMAAEYIEKVRMVPLGRQVDQGLQSLVEQARKRIADAADAEGEFLFGLGDTNRWNGAQIADTDYRRSFRPSALAIADAWTMELLWGGLRGLGRTPAEYRRVRVLVDPTGVVAPPDLGKAATEGLQLGAISYPAWRNANGFGEDAAPTPEEQRMLVEYFGRRRAGLGGGGGSTTPPDEVHEVNEDVAATPGEPELPRPRQRPTAGPLALPAPLAALLSTAADPTEQNIMDELLLIEQMARARLEEAAESALDAQLNRAGAKLRNWARRAGDDTFGSPGLLARVTEAETIAVLSVLGPDRAAALAGGQYANDEARRDDLFAAALAALLVSFRRIVSDVYARVARVLGVTVSEGEIAANTAAGEAVLAGGMIQWADRTVFDPVRGPSLGEGSRLRVPTPVLRRAAAAAGGAPVAAGIEATVEAAGGTVFGPTVMAAAEASARARGEELARLGFRWVYGVEPRSAPWPAHMALNGRVLSGPDDPALIGQAPGGGTAYPGDHAGCRCDWVPVVSAEPSP